MKIKTITFLLALLACTPAFGCPCGEISVPAEPPADTDYLKGFEYTKTDQYKREFSQAVRAAQSFCRDYLAQHKGDRNLAIVSDLDETLLDNREEFRRHPERNWQYFEAWMKEARAPLLEPTAKFLRWARNHGFAIFFVTGRPEIDRLPTIENLVRNKLSYDALYMKPEVDGKSAAIYKSAVRAQIEKMGFKIVVSIGDQYSDLAGGSALDCEKLPNKMYFLK